MSSVVVNHVSDLFNWWGRELSGLVPSGWRFSRGGRGPATVISLGKSKLEVIEDRGRGVRVLATIDRGAEPWGPASLSVLDGLSVRPPVGLRVPLDTCFVRTLDIPAAARADALALATLDLERATPFRRPEVMSAVYVDATAKPIRGRIVLRQLVLKRAVVEDISAGLDARGLAVTRIDCWNGERTAALPLDFLLGDVDRTVAAGVGSSWLSRALALVTVASLAAALALVLIKHENALAVIGQETAAARSTASEIGQRIATSEAALAAADRLGVWRQSRPLGVEILAEVTRLLPDGTYLTEFNLDGDQLDLTGFATSAAPLLEAFERSGLFKDARFTTPFRLEPREDRERFSMRVRLRDAPGLPSANADRQKG